LGRETQPQVRAAAIRALASLGGSDAYADIQAYYDDPVLLNRQAALIGSLRGGSHEGLSAASQRVLRLSKSGTAVDRSLAAVVFGEAGDHQFTQPLRDLLMDVDYTVRRKALNSAAQLKSLELWPLVVENLSLPRSRRAALCALWKGDEAVLAEIRKEFAREDTSPAVLALLAKACGRIAGPGAIEILQTRLDDPRPDVRTQVLLGLKRCGYQASAEMDIKIQEKIRDEAEYAAWLSALTSPIAQDSRANILREALGDQLNLSRERIFCLLSYIYPRDLILKAQEALQRSTAEQAANALEALEVALPQGLKAIILPVIEDLEPAQRHTRFQSTFPQPAFTLHQSLIELTNPDRQVSSWIRSCAEHVSTHL
jgi:HEAT repeat protein